MSHVGTWWQHTPQGVAEGGSPHTRFAVYDEKGGWLYAARHDAREAVPIEPFLPVNRPAVFRPESPLHCLSHFGASAVDRITSIANIHSFMGEFIEPPKVKVSKEVRKAVKRAAKSLTEAQIAVLIDLLGGESSMVHIAGVAYAVKPVPDGWSVWKLDGSSSRLVSSDLSACTCEDSRFRERECKHIRAVRRMRG